LGVCEPAHCDAKRLRGKGPAIHYRTAIYADPSDMDFGDSFSKLKKKVKHRLTERKHKSGRKEADADGEVIDPAGSLLRPEPHVVAGGGGGSGGDADERQTCLTDPSPQQGKPEPVPAGGSENNKGEGGVDVCGREVSQGLSHLHLDVRIVGRGHDQVGDDTDGEEGEQFHSCSSTASTLRSEEPDGA